VHKPQTKRTTKKKHQLPQLLQLIRQKQVPDVAAMLRGLPRQIASVIKAKVDANANVHAKENVMENVKAIVNVAAKTKNVVQKADAVVKQKVATTIKRAKKRDVALKKQSKNFFI